MISEIFQTIGEAITAFAQALASGVTSITSMFYTPGSGSDPGSMTFLGTLLLIAAGVGIVYWAFYLIRNLLRVGVK